MVGWDFDQVALDAGFARARERGLAFTPLYFDAFPDYGLEPFLDCLGAHATIERMEAVNGRQLIWFRSDNT